MDERMGSDAKRESFHTFSKGKRQLRKEKKTFLFTPAQYAEHSVVLFAAKHSNNLVINMNSFRQHPAKRCAEKVMCCYGYDPASQLKEQHNFSQTKTNTEFQNSY